MILTSPPCTIGNLSPKKLSAIYCAPFAVVGDNVITGISAFLTKSDK